MARIRTIKPELLEDERTATLDHLQWRIFVSLLLLCDDYGNFRANPGRIAGAALWAHDDDAAPVLEHLDRVGLVKLYTVGGQRYGHISSWEKHQKVDHPGKPSCPGPEKADSRNPREDLAKVTETLAPDLIGSEGIGSESGGGAPARDPAGTTVVRESQPAAPYLDLPQMFGRARFDVLKAGTEFQGVRMSQEAIRATSVLAEEIRTAGEVAEVAPTMRLFFERVKSGEYPGYENDTPKAFGRWRSLWTNLRDDIRGVGARVPPAARGSPRRASDAAAKEQRTFEIARDWATGGADGHR